jgi:TnpA family transposase
LRGRHHGVCLGREAVWRLGAKSPHRGASLLWWAGADVNWHVEKQAVCLYSQLNTVSSSKVAATLKGLLWHGTEVHIEKNRVDSHGQSAVAFAFCHLRWGLIRHQYDQMIKYATSLRLGTAGAETILERFTRSNFQHPTYQVLTKLGQAVKAIFLCRCLHEDTLRREVHDGLQVIENWNSANAFHLLWEKRRNGLESLGGSGAGDVGLAFAPDCHGVR